MSELKDTKNTTELLIVQTPSISNIIDITNFGTLTRLINVSLILKFIRKLRKQFVESINYQLEAEKLLLQEVQGTLTARKDFLSLKRQLTFSETSRGSGGVVGGLACLTFPIPPDVLLSFQEIIIFLY